MTTLADITAADWSLRLGEVGEVVEGVEDIAQCLRIIVTTQKGTDPLRPEFSCNLFGYIDQPIPMVIPLAVRDITEAIRRYETRVTLLSVMVVPIFDQGGGAVEITINWRLNVQGQAGLARSTVVTVPRAS